MHAAALEAANLRGAYRLYPIPPDDSAPRALSDLVEAMRSGEVHGLNVTIPHKQRVIPLLGGLTSTARQIGAVNTLLCEGGRVVGDNTDAPGFLSDLGRMGWGKPGTAVILGAGGSARAVAHALAGAGWVVRVAARRLEQAQGLVEALGGASLAGRLDALPLDRDVLAGVGIRCDLIVNCTPVGMTPARDANPWPAGLPLPTSARVYDLVYNPPETALVRAARAAGLPAAGGLGMLVEQAALAFERWTERKASRAAMRSAVSLSHS